MKPTLPASPTLRAKMKDKFEEQAGTKLTFMPFFVRAAVEALRAFPTVNASVDGTNIVLHKECNIGIAVALDWGLIVPVIKNAEEKNFLGIARAHERSGRARPRQEAQARGSVPKSTFSITNPGVFGGLFGLPVINQPNVAILGLGTIEKRPGGGGRRDRHPLDGLPDAVLRSSRGGRRRGAPVHGQAQAHARELERKHPLTATSIQEFEQRVRGQCFGPVLF